MAVFAILPLGVQANAITPVPSVYQEKLQSLYDTYGVPTQAGELGVYDFVLVDISGDGIQELVVLWMHQLDAMSWGCYTIADDALVFYVQRKAPRKNPPKKKQAQHSK